MSTDVISCRAVCCSVTVRVAVWDELAVEVGVRFDLGAVDCDEMGMVEVGESGVTSSAPSLFGGPHPARANVNATKSPNKRLFGKLILPFLPS